MLRHPGKAIIFLPFIFKSCTIASPGPEFRFFQVDSCYTGVNYLLYQGFKISDIIICGNYVRNAFSMPDMISVSFNLSLFLFMRLTVPFTGKIILVITPRNARHKLYVI